MAFGHGQASPGPRQAKFGSGILSTFFLWTFPQISGRIAKQKNKSSRQQPVIGKMKIEAGNY